MTEQERDLSKVPEHLRPYVYQKGENGGAHRPKGRHKLEALVRRALNQHSQQTPSLKVDENWSRRLALALDIDPTGKAAEWVIAREWPVTNKLQVGGDDDAPPIRLDYSKLDHAELTTLKRLLEKAKIEDAE